MTPPRAVLFDLDNTAYAYAPCHRHGVISAAAVAAELHAPWAEPGRFAAAYDDARRRVKANVGDTAASHCRLLYFKTLVDDWKGKSDLDAAMQLDSAYWRGYAAAMQAEPSCRETFADLRAAGVRTAWVTNFTTPRQLWKLDALELTTAADFLFTSEEAGADKPDPRVVRLALDRVGVAAEECWLVGDDRHTDGGAAAAAGCRFVWYRRDEPADGTADVADWVALRRLLHAALGPRP